ncbi:MAG: Carbamoyl transferase [Microgenomates group bacterium GW2011_GWC1_41_8]|uniref:Putative carbamoyl transferase, NodU family n=2 Tax=Candidatus Roizmaniibacteriota TaxID=1752723 RepID=A0A0G0VLY5_9BACT|nr:MAG: putative carbamoyl transferase, NodU family [Candidatus Roizmanbacteria bacterium GW2011_GWB1_40_7]KKR94924.1 MAG: putative carbamoyl transferase, NodU family [Candidatus Roizmanbacteria bacterium GW2011_GWA1_41_13]KKS23012.1 MAG: Carbamoyl transferase [Microgenomates group bacterium GW2011_GWC1_41_8]OGK48725.1 MAG: hypothetical protein A3A55_03290 [Candidatus Roizmanbacteria bacterium RIFCSPLOWO2_01_FULL_40_14]
MYILGIYYGHNASAILLNNGKVIAGASEERFNGKKNYIGYPESAIQYILSEAGIRSKQLTAVTVSHTSAIPVAFFSNLSGSRHVSTISFFRILDGIILLMRKLYRLLAFYAPVVRVLGRYAYRFFMNLGGYFIRRKEQQVIASRLGINENVIHFYDHHLSHGAAGYYASPFNQKKALVITLDGEGDGQSGSVRIFNNKTITELSRIPREYSLGTLFAQATGYLGMKIGEDEYKLMGLAPYSKKEKVEKVYKEIENIVQVDTEKLTISTSFNTNDSPRYLRRAMQGVRFDVVAGVFQYLLEEKIAVLVKAAIKKTGVHTIVLSGGIFMNVKINQRIGSIPEVKELFIMPTCGDETSILGSSYLHHIQQPATSRKKVTVEPIKDLYWGPRFTNKQIQEYLKKNKLSKKFAIQKIEKIEKKVAQLLANGHVVARLAGRMEFGARSLGNRSILADPRNFDVVRIINEQMKNRDFWMPFAPSILDYRMKDYCINPKNFNAPYMILSFDSTPLARKDLKASLHPYDFTLRPQVVYKEWNESYYKIIEEFEKLTGVGGILNTSFNLHGFPIVAGPKEALFAFEHSGLDYLVLENFLISKNKL